MRTNKKAQKKNLHLNKEIFNLHFCRKKKSTKAQEEMIGFALILIIVAVIGVVFLSLSLKNSSENQIESYEVKSFLQSYLQSTTSCQDYPGEFYSVRDLIHECEESAKCYNGQDTCEVLNSTTKKILRDSWSVGEDWPEKGYELRINSEEKKILFLNKGNETKNIRAGFQDYSKKGKRILINFKVYY